MDFTTRRDHAVSDPSAQPAPGRWSVPEVREDAQLRTGVTFSDGPANIQPSEPASSRQTYSPQFSSVSAHILSRLQGRASADESEDADRMQANKDAFEDTNSHITQDMSAHLTLPLPLSNEASSQSLSLLLSTAGRGQGPHQGIKRKRESPAEAVDFTQTTMALPTSMASKQLPTSGADANPPALSVVDTKRCRKCQGRDTPSRNQLVRCSACTALWHQQCASPAISFESAQDPNWRCSDCLLGSTRHVQPSRHATQPVRPEVERLRRKRLSALPQDVLPPKVELLGFTAEGAPRDARTEYFYGKTKTDLLNLLSFCDELRPQLLVDLLVSITKKHPDLPIFDSPDWQSRMTTINRPRPGLSTKHKQRAHDRPRHGHTINPKPRLKPKPGRRERVHKPSPMSAVQVAEEDPVEEYEDTLPPTWPKAGKGLYTKLVPDTEDRKFLLDLDDEEAFSHFMVDKLGRQVVEPAQG